MRPLYKGWLHLQGIHSQHTPFWFSKCTCCVSFHICWICFNLIWIHVVCIFCAYSHFMNFSCRYCVFGKSQTDWVRNSGANTLSTRKVWRAEIPAGLVRLSEVAPVTMPAWLFPSCQAQDLPSSMATPRVGGHQVSAVCSLGPGLWEHRLSRSHSLPAAWSPHSWGAARCPALAWGSCPASAGRQVRWLRGTWLSCSVPCRLPCQMDRQKAGSMPGHLPRQAGNLRSWGEYFAFKRKWSWAN